MERANVTTGIERARPSVSTLGAELVNYPEVHENPEAGVVPEVNADDLGSQ